jgi:hypothetical protein
MAHGSQSGQRGRIARGRPQRAAARAAHAGTSSSEAMREEQKNYDEIEKNGIIELTESNE